MNKVLDRFLAQPEQPWSYPPCDPESVLTVNELESIGFHKGVPKEKGTYILWYSHDYKYLGWSEESKGLHTMLIYDVQRNKRSFGGMVQGHKGRNGRSWALTDAMTMVLFIEKRLVPEAAFSSLGEYQTQLIKHLRALLHKASDDPQWKARCVDAEASHFSLPGDHFSLETWGSEIDPLRVLDLASLAMKFNEKQRIIRRIIRQMEKRERETLSSWVLSELLLQLDGE